jgi:hypothetical protein
VTLASSKCRSCLVGSLLFEVAHALHGRYSSMSMSPIAGSLAGSASSKQSPSSFACLGPRPKSIAKQYEAASALASTNDSSVEDLYKITWGQRRFVIGSLLDRRKSRGRRSWIGNHGWFLAELGADSTSSGDIWCCRPCDEKGTPQFFNAQSTSSAQAHLRKLERRSRNTGYC